MARFLYEYVVQDKLSEFDSKGELRNKGFLCKSDKICQYTSQPYMQVSDSDWNL